MCTAVLHSCYTHVETTTLICRSNQLTGFYINVTQIWNGLRWKAISAGIQKILLIFEITSKERKKGALFVYVNAQAYQERWK